MVDMLMIMSSECRLLSSAFRECHFSVMKMSLSCQINLDNLDNVNS